MNIVSFLFNSRMLKLNFIIIFERALVFSRNKKKILVVVFYPSAIQRNIWLQQNEHFHNHLKYLSGAEYDNTFGMVKILVSSWGFSMPERINPQSVVISAALVLYYPASLSYRPYGDSGCCLAFSNVFCTPRWTVSDLLSTTGRAAWTKRIFSYFLISFLLVMKWYGILILYTRRLSKDCDNFKRGSLSLLLEILPVYRK